MENNKTFHIKYKDSPVEINTHCNTQRTALKLLPLETVGHLVAAFFPNTPPNELGQYSLHLPDGNAIPGKTLLLDIQTLGSYEQPLIIKSRKDAFGINDFLSSSLADIEKALSKPSTTGTKRIHPKIPKVVERWDNFITEAARYEYPTTPIGADVVLPPTTEIKFKLERDVDKVIGNHLDNFNRIFRDQGKACRFESKVDVFLSAPETEPQENHFKFIGVPDNVFTLDSKVLSFVEDKTPNDLPVSHYQNGDLFDLLEIYKEDIQYVSTCRTRADIGRKDVRTVIDQVYGYLSLNNLIYGCVTCYDVTYFLWRPRRGTLLISHPIFNRSRYPSLLQALYYFVQIVLQGHDNEQQSLDPSPKDSDLPVQTNSYEEMDTDTKDHSDSGSNYSSFRDSKNKRTKYDLDLDSLRSGTVVGFGATGQVIRLKDSNIVVKHCDSYNNPDGFKMLKNEITVYEKLSKLNLEYIPRYYGEYELYGQYFIAMDFIPGKHCDWKTNRELNDKLDFVIRNLKSFGVVHQDLRPENVLVTREGDIKLIDFGKADII
jgi:hypothetical protein